MESFMDQLKVFENLCYALFTESCPLFLKLKTIIRSLLEYKPTAQALIKNQQRAAIAWIITLQTKHYFRGESNQLAEFVIMNNNLRARNPLIYHAEMPLALYRKYDPPAAGQKRKFDWEDKPIEDSRSNKKANPNVGIHDLLRNHFTNGIWKVNLSLRFRDLESFCNVCTSVLSKENKICTLGMFQWHPSPYRKNTYRNVIYEEAKHMVNILDKAIKNPNQVQVVSAGEKRN